MKVNIEKKEIDFEMTKNTHQIHNQMRNEKCRKKKMWQTLIDSQSKCDVIVNSSVLQIIRAGG